MTIQTINRVRTRNRIVRWVADFWTGLQRERRIRHDIRYLETFSDRDLRDMGLHRGDLAFALRHGHLPERPG